MASIWVCESSPSTACAAFARRASARASAMEARSRSEAGLGAVETAMARGAARSVAADAIEPGLYHIAPGATTAVSCRAPALCRRFPTRSDIPHDVPTDKTSLVCAGSERAGLGVRPRRRSGPASGHCNGDLREVPRRAWQPHPGHLQVPGRRQRPGLRPGLPRVRPLPRRRRRADVDRRSRSVSADQPVEARPGDRVHAHDVHPGSAVHRRCARCGWVCTPRATSAA